MVRFVAIAGVCLSGLAGSALAQAAEPDNAKALLEKVKHRDLERQVTARQTEIDRLAEDLAKGHKEAETMQANLDTTGNLLKESAAHLDQLISQRKRLEQVMELTTLRIEAERLKAEGLRLLGDAQGKALIALTKRAEETDARASLGGAELKMLAPPDGAPVSDAPRARPALTELRKKLALAESATANAEKIARDGMRAASSKLELADIAGVKAKRKGAGAESDLPEIAEKPADLSEKQPVPAKKPAPAKKAAPAR